MHPARCPSLYQSEEDSTGAMRPCAFEPFLRDLNGLLAGEIPRAKAEKAKHCTDITLTPARKLKADHNHRDAARPGSAWRFFFRASVYDLAEVQASFSGRVKHGIS